MFERVRWPRPLTVKYALVTMIRACGPTSAGCVPVRVRIADAFYCPGESMAHQHDAAQSSSDERILHEITTKERELQEQLTQAQREAARILEEAQRAADAIRSRAREQAQQETAAATREAAGEAQAITEQTLSRARAEAEAVRERAQERMSRAVEVVVREVLGGNA